jgi:hypothetical protein
LSPKAPRLLRAAGAARLADNPGRVALVLKCFDSVVEINSVRETYPCLSWGIDDLHTLSFGKLSEAAFDRRHTIGPSHTANRKLKMDGHRSFGRVMQSGHIVALEIRMRFKERWALGAAFKWQGKSSGPSVNETCLGSPFHVPSMYHGDNCDDTMQSLETPTNG